MRAAGGDLILGTAGSGLVLAVATSVGWRPAAIVAAVTVAVLAARLAGSGPRTPRLARPPIGGGVHPPITPVERLASRLSWALADTRGPARALTPLLRQVAAPVLAEHGLDTDRDVEAVRRLLGADNAALLATPSPAVVSAQQLDRFVQTLERLTG